VEKSSVSSRRAFWTHVLFYYAPLVATLALALFLATTYGSYTTSLRDIYGMLAFLGPEYPRTDINSMYGINGIARRVAYLVQYGVITLLSVRALQGGRGRLRKRSVLAVLLIGILFIGLDNAVRNHTPGRHGGWDDIFLSLLAVSLTTAGIGGYFAVKNWEHSRLANSVSEKTTELVSTTASDN
jgi:uncharacterized membrane protein YhaH (DUF805 family)